MDDIFFWVFLLAAVGTGIFAIVKGMIHLLRIAKIAFALGLRFQGIGLGTIKFSGVKMNRNIVYTFHRKKKGYIGPEIDLFVETKQPHMVTLRCKYNEHDATQNLDDPWEIDAIDSAAVQPMLTHPVVKAILLDISNGDFKDYIMIGLPGIFCRGCIYYEDVTADDIWHISEPVFQLALYLSLPDHLQPVASVEKTLAALSKVIAGEAEHTLHALGPG